jgi:hypothetical protein
MEFAFADCRAADWRAETSSGSARKHHGTIMFWLIMLDFVMNKEVKINKCMK